MEAFAGVLGWTSPFGVGFFLVCLGLFIFLLGHADPKKKKDAEE